LLQSAQSPSPSPSLFGSGGRFRQKRHIFLLAGKTSSHGGLRVLRRHPSSHSSFSKSLSKLSSVFSASILPPSSAVWGEGASPAILSPSSSKALVWGEGGGGESGASSLSAQSSPPLLMLSAQGLAATAARLVSGVGGSGRPPPLAAARVRGRFAGGDPAGGEDSTELAVGGNDPLSIAAAGGARRCLLLLSRYGLFRRRRVGAASVGTCAVHLNHRLTSWNPSFRHRSHASN